MQLSPRLAYWYLTSLQSSHGIWAGHLWEGSKTVNGGSSFNHRFSKDVQTPRPPNEFKTVAVDIFDQATPARQKAKRPLWKSLVDVKNDHDDPFNDVEDVQIFLLTKAQSYVCLCWTLSFEKFI